MAAFTAQDVKTLREKTGCGMMDCKKALTNADGDMDKAVDFLREQGLAKQAKKAGRIAAEGVAYACTNDDLSVGVVVEVNAETDFVAKNDSFMDFEWNTNRSRAYLGFREFIQNAYRTPRKGPCHYHRRTPHTQGNRFRADNR